MPLTIKPPSQPSLPTDSQSGFSFDSSFSTRGTTPDRASSPAPPLASPLTPTASRSVPFGHGQHATLAGDGTQSQESLRQSIAKPDLIDRPPSKPFSGEDATDAIALRAAISSLQFQRKRAVDEIKTLRMIKEDALSRPDAFREHVVATATAQAKGAPSQTFKASAPLHEDGGSDDERPDQKSQVSGTSFPAIPNPQDVVRCPPINWDKYHIVGETLDRMHNAQQAGTNVEGNSTRAQSFVSAAYDPAIDRLEGRSRGGEGGRKDSGASATGEPQVKSI